MTIRRRLAASRIVRPLRRRDFALVSAGSIASLLGDGFFHVALAWQVYTISNVPTALSIVFLGDQPPERAAGPRRRRLRRPATTGAS